MNVNSLLAVIGKEERQKKGWQSRLQILET
jgi:hypothetical protein